MANEDFDWGEVYSEEEIPIEDVVNEQIQKYLMAGARALSYMHGYAYEESLQIVARMAEELAEQIIADKKAKRKANEPPRYLKEPISSSLRRRVFERDRYRCRACGDWHNLQVDHIHPESLGGETILDNLQALCRTCNLRKGTKLPAEIDE